MSCPFSNLQCPCPALRIQSTFLPVVQEGPCELLHAHSEPFPFLLSRPLSLPPSQGSPAVIFLALKPTRPIPSAWNALPTTLCLTGSYSSFTSSEWPVLTHNPAVITLLSTDSTMFVTIVTVYPPSDCFYPPAKAVIPIFNPLTILSVGSLASHPSFPFLHGEPRLCSNLHCPESMCFRREKPPTLPQGVGF